MRKLIVLALFSATAGLGAASPVLADDVVVELFTSQGCSSCPPADQLLGDLAKRDGVIALSLHVDYWDYLGWVDAFASPEFTLRQKTYAKASGATMIYTPQMVIGGTDMVVGTRAMEVADALQAHAAKPAAVDLSARSTGGGAEIRATGQAGAELPAEIVVQFVRYMPSQTVKIERGENAGREITYHNIVTSWAQIAVWDGAAPLTLDAPMEGDDRGVVILQDGVSGPILAAVRVD